MISLRRHIPFLNRKHVSTKDKIVSAAALIFVFVFISVALVFLLDKQAGAPTEDDISRGFSFETKTAPCLNDPQALCDKILRPDYKFSAVAPKDWIASQPNSATIKVEKEGLACPILLIMGDNDKYVSASGWVDILNPPGKKGPFIKDVFGGVIPVGPSNWPAAHITTRGQLENIRKEVYIPVGNVIFILNYDLKALVDKSGNFAPNPDEIVCDKGLNDLLAAVKL